MAYGVVTVGRILGGLVGGVSHGAQRAGQYGVGGAAIGAATGAAVGLVAPPAEAATVPIGTLAGAGSGAVYGAGVGIVEGVPAGMAVGGRWGQDVSDWLFGADKEADAAPNADTRPLCAHCMASQSHDGEDADEAEPDPADVPATPPQPPISPQKQDGHVRGTPQNDERNKQGKPTSTFDGDRNEADSLTQEAWDKGTQVPGRPGVRDYDFQRPIGQGPRGGRQSTVRVHEDASGRIHGHPSGPET